MNIYFINNQGSGFAERVDVPEGTAVGQLFAKQMPDANANDYLIRVDRQPVAADEPLRPDCRVSVTPTKIAGAA